MLCHQCGSSVDADASSCQNCGAELRSTRKLKLTESRGLRISQQLRAIRIDQQIFPPGEEVASRFVLGEMIGQGPFGEVYRARDKAIDAEVAVKIFGKELLPTPRDEEQFLRATRAGRRLTQANAVRLHNSGVHKGHPWVSMQLLEGLSLRKVLDLRLAKGETFELTEAEPVIEQIALALDHVAKEFPHGNIKPDNVVFLPDLIKVTDSFILAAFPAKVIIPRLRDNAYFAPELHTAETEPTARADVYSVGVILGEMLFGPDYTPGSANAGPVEALIKRATAFDPSERYASVGALSEELTTVAATGALLGAPAPRTTIPPAPPPGPAPSDAVKLPPVPPTGEASEPEVDVEATIEYSRDLDDKLQDSILTREVDRDRDLDGVATDALTREVDRDLPAGARTVTATGAVPKPTDKRPTDKKPTDKKSTGKDAKSSSKPVTTTTKAPTPRQAPKGPPVLLLLLAGIVLAALIAWALRGDSGVEEIGQPAAKVATKSDGSKAKTEPEVAPKTTTTTASSQVAAESASSQLLAAATTANSAANTPAATETEPVATPAEATTTEPVAAATPEPPKSEQKTAAAAPSTTTEPKSQPKTTAEPKSQPKTQPKTEQKTAPKTTASTKTDAAKSDAASGTDCPAGMGLVKSSGGNYCIDRYEYPGGNTKPRTGVTWFQASSACESKGKRLCALSEWRNACGARYPYGSSFDANKCNTNDEDGFERSLAATGSFKECRSRASGAYDMVGNVHEWVQEQRIAGGGFESGEEVASCRYSSAKAPSSSDAYVGFRCCADPQ